MLRLDHVQLAIPPGAEDACRAFYIDLLGMAEEPKPPVLAARGGLWLRSGEVRLHLGVEQDFRPARKAHPAILVGDLDGLARKLSEAGHVPVWDDAIPGTRRFYATDPVGNRLEFVACADPAEM
ncbi:VOC family protein [Microvirga subterranea]|uniref:Catechol 2,3-dioxygenase-like lactoylglutathione lyase family enzyme n=1 Tax=Microvirga subterranea TaxID=186651 RepID=A0A370HK74_9HYPH|nr:VOC family protein [Microvirga subterranea]RDI58919.1 catechol 2,3-dioxygenase-like lactoylglutathione lyase family enzyme [Microvirga subterranea]